MRSQNYNLVALMLPPFDPKQSLGATKVSLGLALGVWGRNLRPFALRLGQLRFYFDNLGVALARQGLHFESLRSPFWGPGRKVKTALPLWREHTSEGLGGSTLQLCCSYFINLFRDPLQARFVTDPSVSEVISRGRRRGSNTHPKYLLGRG